VYNISTSLTLALKDSLKQGEQGNERLNTISLFNIYFDQQQHSASAQINLNEKKYIIVYLIKNKHLIVLRAIQ